MFEVQTQTIANKATAIGSAGPFTLVVDRPLDAGGGGLGFNGGELLHLAVAGCVSNDLFREAARLGLSLTRVVVRVEGGFAGDPAKSTGIVYEVDIDGEAPDDKLDALVRFVDEIC
jgi:uncharacterized OsmC-like protein